jgi:hypothetical protein
MYFEHPFVMARSSEFVARAIAKHYVGDFMGSFVLAVLAKPPQA